MQVGTFVWCSEQLIQGFALNGK